jgi:hypothetical protein
MAKNELTSEQVAMASRPTAISVHVPVDLLWDFDSLTKVKKEILGRLGCLACTSGFDIRWRVRDFVVNPALKISELNELAR